MSTQLSDLRTWFPNIALPDAAATPTPAAGGGIDTGGGGGSGNALQFRTGADGTLYQSADGGRTWTPAPDILQPAPKPNTSPLLPIGNYPIPMASANEALLGVPQGAAGPTAAGNYLAASGDFTQFANANTLQGQGALNAAQMRYLDGTATAEDVNLLLTGNQITMAQAQKAMQGAAGGGGLGGAGGGSTAQGNPYTQLTAYESATLARQAQQDALAQQQQGVTNAENARMGDQSILNNRAGAGQSLATLENTMAQDAYVRAKDPGNFPAYLQAQSGVPGGTPALTSLLGNGYQIAQTPGSNPLSDPRFANLENSLYTYGTVPNPAAIDAIRAARNSLGDQQTSQLFQNFANYDAARAAPAAPATDVPAHAHGGTQMLNGPVVGIPQEQMQPGQTPQFLAGEAGKEKLTFTPMHHHPQGASHMHSYADGGVAIAGADPGGNAGSTLSSMASGIDTVRGIANDNGGTLPQSFYDYTGTTDPNATPAGQTYTPAEGTSVALYKALKPLGYAPPEVMGALQSGNALTPNMVAGKFGDRLQRENPSLWQLVTAAVQARVGSAGLADWTGQSARYDQAGFSTSGTVKR
jgi:hypothetical protein